MRQVVTMTSNRLSAEALSLVLTRTEFEIAAAIVDPARISDTLKRHRPELVLVDLEHPHGLLAVLDDIRDAGGRSRIVVLSSSRDALHLLPTIGRGAHGFVLRDRTSDELLTSFRQVAAGGVVIDPRVAGRFVSAATRGARVSGPYGLSRQEQLVVEHLPKRMTNGQIGEEVGLSTATVKTHLSSAFRKLGVANRHEAAAFATEHGLA